MNAAQLMVRCLENEGVDYIFGIPGEENLDLMDALLDSKIQFVTTRHEQGAAFMADVYGRVTGRAGVCLATLGPGATNLVTGVADANMDNAPLVAIAGQAGTDRLHKESHQVLDLVNMFRPITKYSTQILTPETIPEIIRKAFKLALSEKPGASFIDFPENIAQMPVGDAHGPLQVQMPTLGNATAYKLEQAANLINHAKNPLVLAGNGVIRNHAVEALIAFADQTYIPVVNSFMAKGVIPFKHPMAMGSAGLQKGDYENCGFDQADVVICVGFDLVEYHPYLWNPHKTQKIVHIDTQAAEVDSHYTVEVGVIGHIKHNLRALMPLINRPPSRAVRPLRELLIREMNLCHDCEDLPMKPQKIIWDLRTALKLDDLVICDVGAHKMWMARMFRCELPNTCIISNGFASMGIAVPGAIAAKLAHPAKTVVAVTGDAGFLMNSQEIETAMRMKTPIIIVIWNDNAYGLIEWKQMNYYGRTSHVRFTNPDFVQYAQSFGARGVRVEKAGDLPRLLEEAIASNQLTIIDCPVDYSENKSLTATLGEAL
jgi:acetolactate synthase-1/2/3 large subunit